MTLTAGVGEVGEVPNLGTCHFGETMLIRLLVRLEAKPHSPVARSDKPKGTAAVVALVPGHCLLLNSTTEQVGCRPFGSRSPGTCNAVSVVDSVQSGTECILMVTNAPSQGRVAFNQTY